MAQVDIHDVVERLCEVSGADEMDPGKLNEMFDAKGLDKDEIRTLGEQYATLILQTVIGSQKAGDGPEDAIGACMASTTSMFLIGYTFAEMQMEANLLGE